MSIIFYAKVAKITQTTDRKFIARSRTSTGEIQARLISIEHQYVETAFKFRKKTTRF